MFVFIHTHTRTHTHTLIQTHPASCNALRSAKYYVIRNGFLMLLGFLLLLHTYWFWLFMRMGYLLLCKFETRDLSQTSYVSEEEEMERKSERDRKKGENGANGSNGVNGLHTKGENGKNK